MFSIGQKECEESVHDPSTTTRPPIRPSAAAARVFEGSRVGTPRDGRGGKRRRTGQRRSSRRLLVGCARQEDPSSSSARVFEGSRVGTPCDGRGGTRRRPWPRRSSRRLLAGCARQEDGEGVRRPRLHHPLPRRRPRGLLRRRRGRGYVRAARPARTSPSPPSRISMCSRLVFVAAVLEGLGHGLVGLRGGTGSGSPRRRRGIAVTARRRPVRGGAVAGHARLHPEFASIILQLGIVPIH